MNPLLVVPLVGILLSVLAAGSGRAAGRRRRRGARLPPELEACIELARSGRATAGELRACAAIAEQHGMQRLAARFLELALQKDVAAVVAPAAPVVPVEPPAPPTTGPLPPAPPVRPPPPGVTRVEPEPEAPILRPPAEPGVSRIPKEPSKLAPDDFLPDAITCSAPKGRSFACRATGATKEHLKELQRAINRAALALGLTHLKLKIDGAIGSATVAAAGSLSTRIKFEGTSVTARILKSALQPSPTPEKLSRSAPVLTRFFNVAAQKAKALGAASKVAGFILNLAGAGGFTSSGEGVGESLVASPWPDVTDEQWQEFVRQMARARVSSVSPVYGLGLFHYDARQLERLGLVSNVHADVAEPVGDYAGDRDVWQGDWIPPHDPDQFLSDGTYQIKVFTDDMQDRRPFVESLEVLGEVIAGKPATLSGLLAVVKYGGENGLVSWLQSPEDRQQFPHTTAAYQRTTGIF